MKTMLDRANPLYGSYYKFREVYLLAAAADEEESAVDGAVKGISGWIACFPKARLAGTVFGGGADAAGAIHGHPALDKAYEMRKQYSPSGSAGYRIRGIPLRGYIDVIRQV